MPKRSGRPRVPLSKDVEASAPLLPPEPLPPRPLKAHQLLAWVLRGEVLEDDQVDDVIDDDRAFGRK